MTIYQGDQYNIPIEVTQDGEKQGAETVQKLEVIFAGLRKEYPGDVTATGDGFHFPLSQEETLALARGNYDLSVRIRFNDETVVGWLSAGNVNVREIKGAEVL